MKQLFPEFEFMWLVDEAKKNLPLELDFLNEGRNAEKVAQMLKHFDFLKVRRQGHGGLAAGQRRTGRTGPSPEPLPLRDPQGVSSSWVFSVRMTDLSLVMHVKALEGQVAAAAAAAKLLQSCLTLCHPIDGSPPGSSDRGIFQARILEWVAIAFSRRLSYKLPKGTVDLSSKLMSTEWSTIARP